MTDQILVNVIAVTNLGIGAQVTIPHGLKVAGDGVTPKLIFANRATPIVVLNADETNVVFQNLGTAVETSQFRCEYGLSNEVDQNLLPAMWYAGGASSGTAAPAGEVPSPGGPYPAIPANTPVGLSGGVLVPATASAPPVPAVGFYSGPATDLIRTVGPITGLIGLPANAELYLAEGGGWTATPPVGAGKLSQRIGQTFGTTGIFVEISTTPTYL